MPTHRCVVVETCHHWPFADGSNLGQKDKYLLPIGMLKNNYLLKLSVSAVEL